MIYDKLRSILMYDASGFAEQHLGQSRPDQVIIFSWEWISTVTICFIFTPTVFSLYHGLGIRFYFHTRWVALSCLAPGIPKVPSGDEEEVIMNSALVAPLTLPTRLLLLLTLFGLLAFGLSSWKSKGNES